MALFGQKWKKLRMDSERKWKVCLIKVPLFLLKNALGASYKRFYIFFVIPLRGHFRHTTPAQISILFFFVFSLVSNRRFIWALQKRLTIFFYFHYALIHILTYYPVSEKRYAYIPGYVNTYPTPHLVLCCFHHYGPPTIQELPFHQNEVHRGL